MPATPRDDMKSDILRGALQIIDQFEGTRPSVDEQHALFDPWLETGAYTYRHVHGATTPLTFRHLSQYIRDMAASNKVKKLDDEETNVQAVFRLKSHGLRPQYLADLKYSPPRSLTQQASLSTTTAKQRSANDFAKPARPNTLPPKDDTPAKSTRDGAEVAAPWTESGHNVKAKKRSIKEAALATPQTAKRRMSRTASYAGSYYVDLDADGSTTASTKRASHTSNDSGQSGLSSASNLSSALTESRKAATTAAQKPRSELSIERTALPDQLSMAVVENMPPKARSVSDIPPVDLQDRDQREPAIFDVPSLRSGIESLFTSTQASVTTLLLTTFGLPVNQVCPVPSSPKEALSSLLVRCFGPVWREALSQVRRQDLLSAVDMTQALLGAWLLDNIFREGLDWQVDLCKELGLFGGGDVVSIVLSASSGLQTKTQRQTYLAIAQGLSDSISKRGDQVLDSFSRTFAARLLSTMDSHLRSLADLAAMINGIPAPAAWKSTLLADLASLVKRALMLKINLCRSRYDHTFNWPAHGVILDVACMKPIVRRHSDQLGIAFTLFAGINVHFPPADNTQQVWHAQVISAPMVVRH